MGLSNRDHARATHRFLKDEAPCEPSLELSPKRLLENAQQPGPNTGNKFLRIRKSPGPGWRQRISEGKIVCKKKPTLTPLCRAPEFPAVPFARNRSYLE